MPGEDSTGNFFKSLNILSGLYGFHPMDVTGKAFPYNLLLAHWDASRQLSDSKEDTELFIVTGEDNELALCTKETVSTGSSLYYIPVLPLFRLLKNRKQRKCGELLLSVCSYLYHIAGVPYYRNSESYLNYHYTMLEEWIIEDRGSVDESDYLYNLSALNSANHYGDIMQRRIYNRYQLERFEERLAAFTPVTVFDQECLNVATTAYKLWRQFPDHSMYRHVEGEEADDDEDNYYEQEAIRVDEYVSFVAETTGGLYDSILEVVNSDFNERSEMQEPSLITVYNRPLAEEEDNLIFERGLFDMISDLCAILNDLP